MSKTPASVASAAVRGAGQDRICLREIPGGVIAAVADGAGGLSGGAEAADIVVSALDQLGPGAQPLSKGTLGRLLLELDERIQRTRDAGETTAVVVVVSDGSVVGASVGDSEAWLLSDRDARALTAQQSRKPLLGSGSAQPRAFGPLPFRGRLILGTDGLFKYCSRSALIELAAEVPLAAAASALVELARLPSGALQDDVAVIVLDATGASERELATGGASPRS